MSTAKLITELEALASSMEAQAKTAKAKHAELCLQKEPAQAAVYERKAQRGEHYTGVIRSAVRLLKCRQKRDVFVPPSREEALEYAKEHLSGWPKQDVISWWNHFESCGWMVGKNKPMVDWHKAAANGYRWWAEKNPGKAAKASKATNNGDPEGWAEYLGTIGRPYKEYRFEAEFIRIDFEATRRK